MTRKDLALPNVVPQQSWQLRNHLLALQFGLALSQQSEQPPAPSVPGEADLLQSPEWPLGSRKRHLLAASAARPELESVWDSPAVLPSVRQHRQPCDERACAEESSRRQRNKRQPQPLGDWRTSTESSNTAMVAGRVHTTCRHSSTVGMRSYKIARPCCLYPHAADRKVYQAGRVVPTVMPRRRLPHEEHLNSGRSAPAGVSLRPQSVCQRHDIDIHAVKLRLQNTDNGPSAALAT